MKKNGRCPAGQYYCYTNKECRPIPAGFMVDPEGMLRKENGATVDEANKSGDSSLRDWFSKSRSSDGKPGWVQLGGKYAGKPCAKQPGQTTKPKCGSSKMKRNLSKDEEERAFRRKNRQDPNPNRTGKAINVATEETKKDHEFSMARSEIKTLKNAAKRLEKKMGKKGEGELKAWVQSKITKASDYIDTAADYVTNEEFVTLPLQLEIPSNDRDFNRGLMFRESLDQNRGMLFVFDEASEQSFHMKDTKIPLDIAFITENDVVESIKQLEPFSEDEVSSNGKVLYALEVNRGWFAENNVEVGDQIVIEAAGEKDACYHKVKSRYKVWPSAYASGALVKCRKKGASNWGNKTKKEEMTPLMQNIISELNLDEKCWPGYEKKGMKTMFGKRYPNCVKKTKSEEVTIEKADGTTFAEVIDIVGPAHIKPVTDENGVWKGSEVKEESHIDVCSHTEKGMQCPIHGKKACPAEEVKEAVRIPAKTGNIIFVTLNWKGKYYTIKLFFPQTSKPNRQEVQDQIQKVYPGSRVQTYYVSDVEPGEPFLQVEDWQSVNRKDKTDGLSQKAVNAYRRENPGSKLKTAVTKKPSELKAGSKDAKRRKSFCSRMSGMKKRLTSAKTARDPDSRINKALRRWNCN